MMDPRKVLDTSPMSMLQIAAVALTVGLNALDGFDVLAISFASPGIAREWGIDRAALGFVLSVELIGMGLGSLLLGGVADRIGRRRTLLGCLAVMSAGMVMASLAHGVYELSVGRVVTGFGIGGVLAATNAVVSESSNDKRRSLNVSLMAIGYPLGAVLGGSVAALLLRNGDWRAVFRFGAAATLSFIPLVWWLLPESIAWLCQRQPRGALGRINRTLARMGYEPIAVLPEAPAAAQRGSVTDILGPNLIAVTVLSTVAYFFHIITFYFILKWVPKIVADMGFSASAAAGALISANVGGAFGGAVLGLLSMRFDLKRLTVAAMLMSTVMVTVFGRGQPDLAWLSLVCAVTGFCTNAGVVGLYGIFAHVFPTYLRATGTGFGIGIGRTGAMLAPVIAGLLFKAGYGLQFVAIVMSAGSTIGAIALWRLPFAPLRTRSLDAGSAAAAGSAVGETASARASDI